MDIASQPDEDARGEQLGNILLKPLGRVDYEPAWQAMQAFTAARNAATPDEFWLLQHPPVYTVGLAGREEHLLETGGIPVVRIDRGGQVTYHGPGQAVLYVLLDLTRRGISVRRLVWLFEAALIDFLAGHGIAGERRDGAPGVYVAGAKIAALGLRVKHGRCYHGISLNVDMDLAPFRGINPCGYPGLAVTQMRDLGVRLSLEDAGAGLARALAARLAAEPSRHDLTTETTP